LPLGHRNVVAWRAFPARGAVAIGAAAFGVTCSGPAIARRLGVCRSLWRGAGAARLTSFAGFARLVAVVAPFARRAILAVARAAIVTPFARCPGLARLLGLAVAPWRAVVGVCATLAAFTTTA